MDILNTVHLESNTQIKINFDGGDLSSDAGLLLFKKFLFKIGAIKLVGWRMCSFYLQGLRTVPVMQSRCRHEGKVAYPENC